MHTQGSPKQNFKASQEGMVWVRVVAISKLFGFFPYYIKGISVLKAFGLTCFTL